MKCFFCGFVGHTEASCLLVQKFQGFIRSIRNEGISSINKVVSTIGDNEETLLAAEIFLLDVVAEVRGSAVSVLELNNYLHDFIASDEHNWRVRLLPKGDFLINFPSKDLKAEYLRRGELRMGSVSVRFSNWDYPEACSFASVSIRRRFKLSGLPPACWNLNIASFFVKSWGKLVEIVDKRRLGNGLLQCSVSMDVRKDLEIDDCWIALFEDRMFIILVEDLDGVVKTDKGKSGLKRKAIDDGLGGGDDDVGNSVFGGLGGRLNSGDRGGFKGRRGGQGFRGGWQSNRQEVPSVHISILDGFEEGEILDRKQNLSAFNSNPEDSSVIWDAWECPPLFKSQVAPCSEKVSSGSKFSVASCFSVLDNIDDSSDIGPVSFDLDKTQLSGVSNSAGSVVPVLNSSLSLTQYVKKRMQGELENQVPVSNKEKMLLEDIVEDRVGEDYVVSISDRHCSCFSYDWNVGVSQWLKLLREPGSYWGITPSFLLFSWWNCYFDLESIRQSLESEYNWQQVDIYSAVEDSEEVVADEVGDKLPLHCSESSDVGSKNRINFPDFKDCGTSNYYEQFENSDYDEVVTSFHKIRASVRRCLEGDLDRISILENMNQDLDTSFAEENLLFDKYSSSFWCNEEVSGNLSDGEDSGLLKHMLGFQVDSRECSGEFQIGEDIKPLDPKTVASIIRYGRTNRSLIHEATGYSLVYSQLYPFEGLQNYTSGIIHHVRLTGLQPGTRYYYQCGDPSIPAMSKIYKFKTMPAPGPRSYPKRIAVVGDLGLTYNTTSTVEHMRSNNPDLIMLVGDISYANLYLTNGSGSDCYSCSFSQSPIHETYQPRWDYWGRYMEPVISETPIMVIEGNHEIELQEENKTFVSYSSRFAFPSEESGSHSTFYYSFNAGGIHFVMLGAYTAYDKSGEQYKWLERDLANVNRSVTPWLVAMWHAPWYSTYKAHYREVECMRVAMEDLLYSYSIDIIFNGHVHAYERSNRVHNYLLDPCGPVHITVGDGGNREKMAADHADEPGNCPEPLTTPDPFMGGFCAFNFTTGPSAGKFCWDRQPEYSAYRESSFGHGILEVKNETHALWTWHRNQDMYNIAGDQIYIARQPDKCPVQQNQN